VCVSNKRSSRVFVVFEEKRREKGDKKKFEN
jgi:hypothetical protein